MALRLQWRDPASDAIQDVILPDQWISGLLPGAVRQVLQRQVRRTPIMTFADVHREASLLEEDSQGPSKEMGSQAVMRAPSFRREPPDLASWKEGIQAELLAEVQDQLVSLSRSIAGDVQAQLQQFELGASSDTPLFPSQGPARAAMAPPIDQTISGTTTEDRCVMPVARLAIWPVDALRTPPVFL
ncbi:hypothetical protein EOD39_3801 [Acipenser ruthenus]|uniref:Uncharacterized protein n=1 Tax=Acipenser ruthenus TaxID=7906 RepID=A0A444ULD7_ACIRT|nr:hypothetical protein EOD39_3801 [Acipenser ruthenus]